MLAADHNLLTSVPGANRIVSGVKSRVTTRLLESLLGRRLHSLTLKLTSRYNLFTSVSWGGNTF